MRIVLLGDSHLARVRRDLHLVGPDVHNGAEGGASALDLPAQATRAAVQASDLVVLSVGTNDAAPWKQVPVTAFARAVRDCLGSVAARSWIYVTPPGVDEARLPGPGDRTNEILDDYREAAISVCGEVGAGVVRAERVIESLGAGAFVDDGVHLSGRGYQALLPAIGDAVRAVARNAQRPDR
ncbi:SGNH/GDSL hydrolase family protein [Nocardioides currus]|uniref:SGNH/GDSL hydrolase family protein n=1 Tax=Nocardioides currus TaxID=2133958 RepID=UPI0014036829|nr:GDSL-type esterase/lipase family protein [Nocardioides currus]